MKSKIIETRGNLQIFTESFGNRNNPVIVLVMGAMNQGLFWYDKFCESVSEKGFFVIRFDHRDTGKSSVIDFKLDPYNLDDLAKDVIEIISGHGFKKVNFVGISMGGYIGQILGANYPESVATLTLISTTADHRPYMDATMGNFSNKYGLPYPSQKFIEYIETSKNNPPKNDEEFRSSQIEGWKIFFGHKFKKEDLNELIRLIDLSNKRNKNKLSPFNHGLAVANSENRLELVKKIKTPTLVIHGTDDVCFSLEHAVLINRSILDSKLKIIEGMGHMFAPSQVDVISNEIFNFIG